MGHLNTLLAKLALDASGVSDLQSIDFFVPVPLHWTRKLRRGYNQAELLAQALSPCRSKVNTDLVRVKRTRPQPAMVSDRKRAANVAGAFAVRKRHDFSDKRICLVDDIKTSGATLNECATTLKNVGAAEVCAIVLAVAERR
jgi:ComF family protein